MSAKTENDSKLTHLDEHGRARMVDVADKPVTKREATAQAVVTLAPQTFALLAEGGLPKGDALATARISGIQAAKKTSDLIPLCHPLPLSSVDVDFELDAPRVRVLATARTTGQTGVEMEALAAASVAALCIYDFCKAVQRDVVVSDVLLVSKTGGTRGDYFRDG